ncbi:MAG: four helix bundle protein [Planctomycetes bacterium]|nr:four helix bundle protein [Planctomycetota bacterium]
MTHLSDLAIYQRARAACVIAYRTAGTFRDSDLRDQIRRAATSVVLNIAEGRGRGSDADFARCLTIARGSNSELSAQITIAVDIGLIDHNGEITTLMSELDQIGRMISALIRRLRGR